MSNLTQSPRNVTGMAVFLLALVTLILYGHTLHVPWYMDDISAIVENPLVRDLSAAWRGVWQSRGLVTLTFALNYRYGALDPASYHLLNIMIHFGCGSLAFLLLRRVFKDQPGWALCGALIFIAHPLQTQAITYTVQRMASLSALFFLLALYLFVRSHELLKTGVPFRSAVHLRCYAGALLSGALSLLCKENAAVLPLALLLFVRFFVTPQPQWRALLYATAPFALLPLMVALYQFLPLFTGATSLNEVATLTQLASLQGNSPLTYLVTEFSVLWIYLRLLVLPYGQALNHDYPIVRELLTWQNGFALLGLLALVYVAWQQRQRRPALAFGICWFFLTLAVESSIIPLDPLFEHRLYLPIFGFSVMVVDSLRRLPWPQVARIGAGLILLVLAILTWQRNELWNHPIAFYQDNLRIAPRSERANNGLGTSYYAAGRLREAEIAFRKTLEINPKYYYNYRNLPLLYNKLGRFDETIALLKQGITYFPEDVSMYNNLAILYDHLATTSQSADQNAQAVRYFEAAMKIDARNSQLTGNLARHYKRLGQLAEAEKFYRQALAINPRDEQCRADLADIYLRSGRYAEAERLRHPP